MAQTRHQLEFQIKELSERLAEMAEEKWHLQSVAQHLKTYKNDLKDRNKHLLKELCYAESLLRELEVDGDARQQIKIQNWRSEVKKRQGDFDAKLARAKDKDIRVAGTIGEEQT